MELKEKILKALKDVYDPELGINVVDLGLIYEITADEDKQVRIKMTLTTPGCPLHDSISSAVKHVVKTRCGIENVHVDLVWEPAWTPERISEEGLRQLRMR
ncbi:iron-sulfur cluster assembly protein [Bacillaceae bacterium]